MEQTLISFHGKQEIKDQYLKRLQDHYDADEIIQGHYWERGKGCAVGCTIHSSKHDSYDTELGVTWRLALLEDSIFEGLPNDQAKEFPIQFLSAIPVGVDTNIAFKKFILWNLADEEEGLIKVVKKQEAKDILSKVANLYEQSFVREIEQREWKILANEADRDYYASAYACAAPYASSSASAYVSAYPYPYEYASAYASPYASAYAYAYASDFETTKQQRIIRMRDKLIEFLTSLS